MSALAPRALLRRRMINVDLSPAELHRLIRALESDAMQGIENQRCHLCEVAADALLRRCAELRELCR